MFEAMYIAAAEGREVLRWDRGGPHPLIDEWARDVCGAGRRAMIVGCGFGTDAELFAQRGFDVVAFDVSPTAIAAARQRFAQSSVDYHVANLLDAPSQWNQAFDLVVESLTVQSMPTAFHAHAIANISRMVAPGGTLLVVAKARDCTAGSVDGPPWPLTHAEIEDFASHGLEIIAIDNVRSQDVPAHWRAEFHRPPRPDP